MSEGQKIAEWDDDRLLGEWMNLFRLYRDDGQLSDGDLHLFRAMTAEMRGRGHLDAPRTLSS